MNKTQMFARRLSIACVSWLLLNRIWVWLEIAEYGERNPNRIDTIIGIILLPVFYLASAYVDELIMRAKIRHMNEVFPWNKEG